jgi:hypothetical protein
MLSHYQSTGRLQQIPPRDLEPPLEDLLQLQHWPQDLVLLVPQDVVCQLA